MSTASGPMSSAEAAEQAARAIAQKSHEKTAAYFAASMLGLMAIFTIFHWIGNILQNHRSDNENALSRPFIIVSRAVRSVLLRKFPGFTSTGHALVFLVYVAINFTLMFQNLHGDLPGSFAGRMGWITACNMALIVFLALKNTPLAFLTAYSYERLNILHQAAGYCTVFSGLLHAVVSLATLSQANALKIMLLRPQVMGIVAGFTLLIILTTALTLRKRYYEVFYGVHIIMFMLIMISLGLHRPYLGLKAVYVFIFTASIWALDRLYRFVKISSLALGNTATINPLPHGGVRVVVRRTPWRAVSGSHVFLWVPKIRAVETHPFTIVSTNPLELVISAHDGFTKDLISFASKNPGAVLRASCDGPYGTLPNFSKFDHVVLVAGGSGASFTFGTALSLIRKMDKLTKKPVIHFIWIIREYEQQAWFAKELTELNASPHISVTIHITRATHSPFPIPKDDNTNNDSASLASPSTHDAEKHSPEKTISSISSSTFEKSIVRGRPDIAARIQEIVSRTGMQETSIVAACGPDGLMVEIRRAVAGVVGKGDRSVMLHCEQFGW